MGESLPSDPSHRVIAIVDDDEDVAFALGSLVESIGLDARLFPSADAYLAYPDTPFALLISDVQMPGTSGIALARILRGAGLPVILISAFPSAEIERQAGLAGARCFLRKPFDPAELIACIERILAE